MNHHSSARPARSRIQSQRGPVMRRHIMLFATLLSSVLLADLASAGSKEDMAEMQKKLNAEVQSRPFSVPEEAKVDAYIEQQLKSDIKPPEYKGSNWRNGFTCNDLAQYSFNEYRNCRYYKRYHGRYYN